MKTKNPGNTLNPFFIIYALLFCLMGTIYSYAQPMIAFETIAKNFRKPVDIKYSGDDPGKLFIVQQTGEIFVFDKTTKEKILFMDVSPKIKLSGQKGLLGLVFDPDYKNNNRFFIYYNESATSNVTVERYLRSNSNHYAADLSTGVVILSEPKPYSGGIHNGGCMRFGSDGYLYIAIGDGSSKGDPNNVAQDGNSLYGKILRIDVNRNKAPYYGIPRDNPFIFNLSVRGEVWATGLRNPWRFSFDRLTNDMWIADVGQKYFEEIDFATQAQGAAGLNYGWRCYEGKALYKTEGCLDSSYYVPPVFVYDHLVAPSPKLDGAVIGGHVYRGSQFPDLQGWYICGDYMLSVVFLLKKTTDGLIATMQDKMPNFTTFGEDENGEIYGADYEGKLYRLVLPVVPPPAEKFLSRAKESIIYPTVVTNNSITIQMNSVFNAVSIMNMNGQAVFTQKLPATKLNTVRLTIPTLTNGMYILQLAGKINEEHKIIIQQ